MPRIFVESEPQERLFLSGEDGRHVAASLRMRPGERLTLCAGTGRDFLCVVESVEKDGAALRVEEIVPSRGEPQTRVVVCQCWPKGDRLETVVQKSVELGAAAIWPLESSRCVARPQGKAVEKKLARLRKIAKEAAQQSERGIVPPILAPAGLGEAMETAAAQGSILFFYEKGSGSLRQALERLPREKKLFVFIGPEGGFSPEEAGFAESLGAQGLSLGPRILRTETAPLAALSAIFFQRGEMEQREGEA